MKCAKCGTDLKNDVLFCPRCGTKVPAHVLPTSSLKNALPSAAIIEGKKTMGMKAKAAYSTIGMLLLVGMAVVFVKSLPGGEHPVIKNQPVVADPQSYDGIKLTMIPVSSRVENGYIVISLAEVMEKKMVGFTYAGKSKEVDLIAYINPEGKLVTSIAMCEPCNSKSFHTESKELVCDNCGTRWNFSNLEGISGTCQKYPPDPIPSEIVAGEIRISQKIVEDWKMRI
ncbi:MAG: Fe-S-containing protein [Bacteroidota bacterium]